MEPEQPEGPEGGQGGEPRVRIAFDVTEELHSSGRVLAAFRGVALAELAREAFAAHVESAKLAEEETEFKDAPRRTQKQKKELFTKALRRRFYPILAAELAKVDLADVARWEHEDPKFERRNNEAQQWFIANHEMRQVKAVAKKGGKDRYLFWQSFQNAHNKNHGRLKGELIARDYADFIDKVYEVADRQLNPKQAKELKDEIKELATRRLMKLTD